MKLNLLKNLSVIIGIVLVWRGIWYVLDWIDKAVFGGSHIITTVAGLILGLIILYIPDHDLKELGKL
jgi:hypothetical protein